MRYASKPEFVERIETTHREFLALLKTIPSSRYAEAGVWGDGWTILDLLAHLTEWEQQALRWYREGRNGGNPDRPAPGYKWNQIGQLNRVIWRKHHDRPLDDVVGEFNASYRQILALVKRLSARELLDPGCFAWTGKYPLTTYLGPNTCSHYTFAIKVLKRWLKVQPTNAN